MTSRSAPLVRLLRAVVATLVIVGLASGAHALGGGSSPGLIPIGILVALIGPLVAALTRARTTAPRMFGAVILGQVATHLLLQGMDPAPGGSGVAAHMHEHVAVAHSAQAVTFVLPLSGPMVVAHLVSSVVAALALTRGEDAIRWVAAYLAVPLPAARHARGGRVRTAASDRGLARTAPMIVPLGERAPPASC